MSTSGKSVRSVGSVRRVQSARSEWWEGIVGSVNLSQLLAMWLVSWELSGPVDAGGTETGVSKVWGFGKKYKAPVENRLKNLQAALLVRELARIIHDRCAWGPAGSESA